MRSLSIRVLDFGRFVCLGLLLLGAMASVAGAGTVYWDVAGPADWTIDANWDTNSQPGAGDRADIENGGTAIINDSDVVTIERFQLAGPVNTSGFIQILDGGSLTTNNAGSSYVGARGLGQLTIEPGATLAIGPGSFYVGWRSIDTDGDADGTVIQNGGTVTMGKNIDLAQTDVNTIGRYEIHGGTLTLTSTSAGYLQIGREGTGIFTQTDGIVTLSRNSDALMVGGKGNSTGTYDMSGGQLNVPNGHMYIGQQANAVGTFNQTGGAVTVGGSDNDLFIGYEADTTGTYNLSGTTSSLTVGDDMLVGDSGTGTFNQTGGAVSVNDFLNLGQLAGSSGTYNLSGGTVDTHTLRVGEGGAGVFTQTGGTVSTAGNDSDLRIGVNGSTTGTYRLLGGIADIADDIYVGFNGTGTLIQDGGTLDSKTLLIARYNGSQGDYTMTAGDLTTRESISVGVEGNGSFTQSGGTVQGAPINVGQNATGVGQMTLSGDAQFSSTGDMNVGNSGTGTLTIDDAAQLSTTGNLSFSLNNGSDGTFIQNGGDVDVGGALRMAVNQADTNASYEIHDGSVTVGTFFQVGRLGEATLYQTGGTITVNRSSLDALTLGDKAGGKGTFITTGGTVNVTAADLTVGAAGTGMLDVRGSNTDIDTVNYNQNALSTFRSAIDSGGASTVDVSGTATIAPGALLDVDVYGGAALTVGDSFDLLKGGTVSGSFNVTDDESLWTVTQDATVVNATLTAPELGTLSASGYPVSNELLVNDGAGFNDGWVAIDDLLPDGLAWIFLDLNDTTNLVDLTDYMEEAGLMVSTDHSSIAPGGDYEMYDLAIQFFPTATSENFIWDFSDFDSALMVTGMAVVVPEPSSFVLFGLAIAGFGAFRVRRRRKGNRA